MNRLIAAMTDSLFMSRCIIVAVSPRISPMRQSDDGSSQRLLQRSTFHDSILNGGQRGVKGRVNHLSASSLATAIMPATMWGGSFGE
jgi:hypothetical protein